MSSIDDPASSSQVWPPSRKEIIGWSGSRLDPLLNDRHATLVQSRLTRIGRSPKGFVTGACVGIDQRVGVWLARVFPHVPQLVLVPADRSRVAMWWEAYDLTAYKITVREMPPGTTYADRNREIVRYSTALAAFPQYPEDHPKSQRSGTWQTIRMARAAHATAPFVFPLEEGQ